MIGAQASDIWNQLLECNEHLVNQTDVRDERMAQEYLRQVLNQQVSNEHIAFMEGSKLIMDRLVLQLRNVDASELFLNLQK